jgi:glycerophosphoryl diester phosphodiesterase
MLEVGVGLVGSPWCPVGAAVNHRRTATSVRGLLVATACAIALGGGLIVAPPADAVPGGNILGHRCRTYDPAVTNEDTVAALIDTSGVPGAWCEIDVWRISDGTLIVWHDSTWGRVADHSTLPAGVRPTDPVTRATLAQVSQIRTKGGQPVATFARMIDASALYHVPLVAEVRNSIPQPGTWVTYARTHLADVRYYRLPNKDCTTVVLDQLRRAGAIIGIKMGSSSTACRLTPDQLQAKGASFISEDGYRVTTAYTSALSARGIALYARGAGKFTGRAILANGAAKLLVNTPRDAANW